MYSATTVTPREGSTFTVGGYYGTGGLMPPVHLTFDIPVSDSPNGGWFTGYVDATDDRTGQTVSWSAYNNGIGAVDPPSFSYLSPPVTIAGGGWFGPYTQTPYTVSNVRLHLFHYPSPYATVQMNDVVLNARNPTIKICAGTAIDPFWYAGSVYPNDGNNSRFLGAPAASATVVDNDGNSYPVTLTPTSSIGVTQITIPRVTPRNGAVYTLTVVGFGGDVDISTLTVAYIPFSVTLTVSPAAVQAGQPYTLTWSSVGATGVDLYVTFPGGKPTAIALNDATSISLRAAGGTLVMNQISYDYANRPYPNPYYSEASGTVYTAVAHSSGSCGTTTSPPATITVSYPSDASTAIAIIRTVSFCSSRIPTSAPPPHPPTSVFLALDAHRRPLAAKADALSASTALGYYSNDAGHSFLSGVIDSDATCTDISLLVDTHPNRYCAVYSKGTAGGLYSAFGPIVNGFPPDVAPALIADQSGAHPFSGSFPIAAQHPTDRLFYLLAYLSGGSLVTAQSGDGGRTWTAAGTIATGQSFATSGRAALAFCGDMAFAAYASGSSLLSARSADRGQTWAAGGSAGVSGPYSGASLLGWQGTLYLLAFAGSPAAPALWTSADLAGTWQASAVALPSLALPSAIGVIPNSGQLRLGITNRSNDNGITWATD